jgi:6-phosphofructokinase 2
MAKIVTLTLNPALDKSASVEHVASDKKLRCSKPTFEPGGGGINVAMVIHRLGGDVTACWTSGGHVGRFFGGFLDERGLPHHPIEIEATTRENFAVFENSSGQQFRFVLPGAPLTEDEIRSCLDWLDLIDPAPDYLVLSGSLPPDVDQALYRRIAESTADKCKVVIDTSGPALKKAVESSVYLIKPNISELEELAGETIDDDDQIHRVARSLIEAGKAEIVLTSLGSGGAILATADEHHHLRAPTVKIRSKIGAGDSTVAGMVFALAEGKPVIEAARYGIAAGSAAVMSDGTELCSKEDTEKLYRKMHEDEN